MDACIGRNCMFVCMMYVCMHANIHTYIHTWSYIHTYMHTCVRKYIHTYIHTHPCTTMLIHIAMCLHSLVTCEIDSSLHAPMPLCAWNHAIGCLAPPESWTHRVRHFFRMSIMADRLFFFWFRSARLGTERDWGMTKSWHNNCSRGLEVAHGAHL